MSLKRAVSVYKNLLEKHTYKVQTVQTGLLLGLGDCIAQNLPVAENNNKPYDYLRTLRFAGLGLCIGPALQRWYRLLDQVFGRETNIRNGIKKVLFDQIICAPAMVGFFISAVTLSDTRSLECVKEKLNRDYVYILIANYKFWPAVQLLNFSITPINYRVAVVQIAAIGWNTFLAWRIHQDQEELRIHSISNED